MLTPSDIVNPKRKSGYDHVEYNEYAASTGRKPFRAVHRLSSSPRHQFWHGLRRATGLEAAQDYCDYMNGQLTPSLPSYPSVDIDMGNTTKHAPKQEKVVVKREVFKGPHDLYDVLFYTSQGVLICRKVGITARGHARYADVCKTFGLSIKPHARAVTFATKALAETAEDAKIAEVCQDRAWKRIGKESFEKVKEAIV